jgi:hypothetical protein
MHTSTLGTHTRDGDAEGWGNRAGRWWMGGRSEEAGRGGLEREGGGCGMRDVPGDERRVGRMEGGRDEWEGGLRW